MTRPLRWSDVDDDVIPPTVGVDIRSATMFYEPDGDFAQPKGGLYLDQAGCYVDPDTGELVVSYMVVGVHHGRPRWHIIDMSDVDWACYTGLVRVDVVRSVITALARDVARNPRNRDHHLGAMLRLQTVAQ